MSTLHPGRAAGEGAERRAQVAFLQPPQAVEVEGREQDMLASMELGLEVVIVVQRVENIAVGYIIRLVTREQLLEVENIAMGHMIRLATLEQFLWLVILGWKDSP
jgi:hypothetical protein